MEEGIVQETHALITRFRETANYTVFCVGVVADSRRRQRVLCENLIKLIDTEDFDHKKMAARAILKAIGTEQKALERLDILEKKE